MIDGIKIFYLISNFQAWKEAVNLEFGRTVLDGGNLKEKVRTGNGITQKVITHRGNFETYLLTVKEICKTGNSKTSIEFNLTIDGSLHKNEQGGTNYLPFTFEALQNQINHIENSLQLTPEFAKITNLEFGVNIPLPFPVFPFLKRNLISYKGQSFNRYNPDRNGVCLGYVCLLSHYSVKIYDKGKQNNLPGNMMRFELRFLKMQKLKGVKTLADLKSRDKVNTFLPLLLEAWENVLLNDSTINTNLPELKPEQREALKNGTNPKYWERLKETNVRRYNYERDRFKKLVATHGKNEHGNILELIKKEWQNLSGLCTNLPCGKTPVLSEFTIKIKGKNVQKAVTTPEATEPGRTFTNQLKVCISCGRDISHQKGNSLFCGENLVGEKQAHQCRNKNSNERNNFKRKVETITGRGVLFDITPFLFRSYNELKKTATK